VARAAPLVSRRRLRLASGLVLFAYVALHLANHSLGLISLALAERGLHATVAVWHSGWGSTLLYGAALVHVALALEAIYARRRLAVASLDTLRIVIGLGIPMLLIGHAIGTRVAWELYAESPQYARVVWSLWSSDGQGRQLALLVPGWMHGCLGIHLALSRRSWYRRLRWPLCAAALLLPLLGALGFLAMGSELAANTPVRARLAAELATSRGENEVLAALRDVSLALYLIVIATAFAARGVRASFERRLLEL
jgi:adenylate cyclase